MPPFTRSQAPLTFPGLRDNALVSSKIVFFMMVALSANTTHWYSILASVSKRFRREVDTLLEDPSVVEQLTLWDHSQTFPPLTPHRSWKQPLCRQGCFMDSRMLPALKKVHTISIAATAGTQTHDHTYLLHSTTLWGSRFPGLKQLTLRGASEAKLAAYLNYFDGQLTHLTTDCVITTEGMRAVKSFPPKVTLTSPAFRQATIMAVPDDGTLMRALMKTVGVMTYKGLDVLEIESYFPSGKPMLLHLTEHPPTRWPCACR